MTDMHVEKWCELKMAGALEGEEEWADEEGINFALIVDLPMVRGYLVSELDAALRGKVSVMSSGHAVSEMIFEELGGGKGDELEATSLVIARLMGALTAALMRDVRVMILKAR